MASPDDLAGILQIPGVQELLNTQITQTRQHAPLYAGATQTALGMLPNSSFGGSSARPDVSAIAPANFSTPAPQSDGLAQALKYLAAAGAGAAAGSGSGGNLANLAKFLKDLLLRHNSGTIQGNKPYPGGALTGPSGFQPGQFSGWDPSVSDRYGNPFLPSDPGSWYGRNGDAAMVNDPSRGSGIGPGMQDYYDWLAGQDGGENPLGDDSGNYAGGE